MDKPAGYDMICFTVDQYSLPETLSRAYFHGGVSWFTEIYRGKNIRLSQPSNCSDPFDTYSTST